MLTPEITLNLIRQRRYGPRAMECRVKACCADNPECPYKVECNALYDIALDILDKPNAIKEREEYPKYLKRENYNKQRGEIYRKLRELGLGSVEARNNRSMSRVRKLAIAPP